MLDVKVLDENMEEIPIRESVDEEDDYLPKPLNLDAEMQSEDESEKYISGGSYTIEDDIVNQIFAETENAEEDEEPDLETGVDNLDLEDDDE